MNYLDHTIAPTEKVCLCGSIIYHRRIIDQDIFFICLGCRHFIKWNDQTLLSQKKLSLDMIDKILCLYFANYTQNGVSDFFNLPFIEDYASYSTIGEYYKLFNSILMRKYIQDIYLVRFEGSVEIDESRLIKAKIAYAPHRRNFNTNIWIFGIKSRGSKKCIFFPIPNKKFRTVRRILLHFISPGTIIFSDSHSSYVNNRVFPKTSKLLPLGYPHYFINHRVGFVSVNFNWVHTNGIESLWSQIKNFLRLIHVRTQYFAALARAYI